MRPDRVLFSPGMGSWRFLLAGLVVASHLWRDMLQGYAAYAVWAFFVLSGYLMTHVLRTRYGFTIRGIGAYAYNRMLRIFPAYFVALLAGVVTLLLSERLRASALDVNPEFFMPAGWAWLNPLTLLAVFPRTGLPVAVSNALAVEVTAYLLMPLLAASKPAAWTALLFAGIATCDMGFSVSSFDQRYSEFLPCMAAFSWGALTRHYEGTLLKLQAPWLSLTVWMLHGAAWLRFPSWPWTYGLYASLPLSSWVVISLFSSRSGRMDRLLGDISYPVYLLHTIVAAWMFGAFGHERSLALFVAAFATTTVLSVIVVRFVEKPLRTIKAQGST